MEWFRHYSGSAFHPKWRTVARRTGATIERVVFVWDSLMEHASAQAPEERGSVAGWDAEVVADHLMCDAAQILAIRAELEAVGSIADERLEGWERRQFVSDSSAERVRRHRERKRTQNRYVNGGETPPTVTDPACNVTHAVRNGPEQNRTESETETETLLAAAVSLPPAPASAREEAPPPGVPAAAAAEDDGSAEVLVRVLHERVAPAGVSRPQVRREVGAWVRQLGLPAAEAAVYEALRSARRNPMSLCGTIVATRHAGRLAAEAAARSPPPEPLGIVRAVQLAAAATDRLKETSHDEPVFLGREFDRECEGMFDPPPARH